MKFYLSGRYAARQNLTTVDRPLPLVAYDPMLLYSLLLPCLFGGKVSLLPTIAEVCRVLDDSFESFPSLSLSSTFLALPSAFSLLVP